MAAESYLPSLILRGNHGNLIFKNVLLTLGVTRKRITRLPKYLHC